MNVARGIKLLEEIEGKGQTAKKGDRVVYNLRIFLNQGEEVPLNKVQSKNLPVHMLRMEENFTFVDHTTTLGKRQTIAGVERSLIGMKEGGYRKVRVSPHLAYGEKGISGLIPEYAVLVIEIWLQKIASDT